MDRARSFIPTSPWHRSTTKSSSLSMPLSRHCRRVPAEALAEQEEQAVPPTAAEDSQTRDGTFAHTFDGDPIGPTRIGLSPDPPSEDDSGPDPLGLLLPPTKPGTLGRVAHYEVHEVLGQGGFGVVVRAFDEKLHRMVAIKALTPAMAATSPPRKRFLREARSAAAIRNENIVSIDAVEEQPIPYLVMEYIPGQTLQQRLDDTGPLEVRQVLTLGRQIAEGLAAAHEQGLIHRDIKPSNILLERGGNERARITDFGLACQHARVLTAFGLSEIMAEAFQV